MPPAIRGCLTVKHPSPLPQVFDCQTPGAIFRLDHFPVFGYNGVEFAISCYQTDDMEKDQALGAVLDTSSLIIIAKLQDIDALHQAYGPLGIPPAVFQEAVEGGKQRGKDDALVIEAAIQAGLVQVLTLSEAQNRFAQNLHTSGALGLGECEALAYAGDTGTRLIIEERKGRVLARAQGIKYTVLQVFPLEGYIQRKISFNRCVDLLDRIAVAMNTDLAILNALKAAAGAIQREREG